MTDAQKKIVKDVAFFNMLSVAQVRDTSFLCPSPIFTTNAGYINAGKGLAEACPFVRLRFVLLLKGFASLSR